MRSLLMLVTGCGAADFKGTHWKGVYNGLTLGAWRSVLSLLFCSGTPT